MKTIIIYRAHRIMCSEDYYFNYQPNLYDLQEVTHCVDFTINDWDITEVKLYFK